MKDGVIFAGALTALFLGALIDRFVVPLGALWITVAAAWAGVGLNAVYRLGRRHGRRASSSKESP